MSESSESRPEYDPITLHHWQTFEIRRLKNPGEDFQQLFEDIMVRAKSGFIRVRPYGNIGDRKCDGLFRQDSIFFQVYSPDELEQAKVQKKIDKDLEGAVKNWGDDLKTWTFVYNVRRGIPPDILKTLAEKQQQYPKIKIDHLSDDDLWEITRDLSIEKRNEILGLPPSPISTSLVNSQEQVSKWRETCRELLKQWKSLTTNVLTGYHDIRFQLDDMFVPLGVVERQKKPRHSPLGDSPEKGSELYEDKVEPISQNDFFEKVLRHRESKNSQGRRIAIIGEPGAGKTTQLQKIGDWILKETDGIPIWVPLTAVGTRKLREYLLSDWLQMATPKLEILQQDRDELGQLLETGKVWLLLDGVDEMEIADALHQITSEMHEGWLKNVRVVLTCRLNVWDAGRSALDLFDVYRNLDFDYPKQVYQFIDQWFATEPELLQKLRVALEQPGKERIRDMVKNPLRLTLLCYSWQLCQGELPETKAGLYEWFVDMFYDWNKGKTPTKLNTKKRKELNRALGELAKAATDQESSRFRLREKFVSEFLGDADDEDSLFYRTLQFGWLNRIGVTEENPLENVYTFFHPTFQEYFAALAIDDWNYFLPREHSCQSVGEISDGYRVFEPHWREVFLLWLGRPEQTLNTQKNEILNKLMNFEDNCGKFYDWQADFLVTAGISEFNNFPEANTAIEKLLELGLGLQRFFNIIAERARKELANTNRRFLSQILVKQLQSSEESNVQRDILEFISESHLHSSELVSELERFLVTAQKENLRCLAACALEKIYPSYPGMIDIIISFLDNESCQIIAARFLGEVRTDKLKVKKSLRSHLENIFEGLNMWNDTFYLTVAQSLLEINSGDKVTIRFLKRQLFLSLHSSTKVLIARILKRNGIIDASIDNILTHSDPYIDQLIENLEDLGVGRFEVSQLDLMPIDKVVMRLATLLRDDESEEIFERTSQCLEIIFSGNRFEISHKAAALIPVEFGRKSSEKIQRNSTVLWHCAQNMRYPDFYRAWHSTFIQDAESLVK